jgi:hypothetical protein
VVVLGVLIVADLMPVAIDRIPPSRVFTWLVAIAEIGKYAGDSKAELI